MRPIWFSRTTNGAADSPTWQSREIFDPGTKNATICNQIVVTPEGTLVNGFYLSKINQPPTGNFVAVIRSTDKGARRGPRRRSSSRGTPRSASPIPSRSTAGRSSPATLRPPSCAPTG
jgi:hypothetical protein